MTLPLKFAVDGIPVSANFRKKNAPRYQAWVARVRQAALDSGSDFSPPTLTWISVEITYFYIEQTLHDVDNLIKPILDAIEGIIYRNDLQVTDVTARKRNIRSNFNLLDVDWLIAQKIQSGTAFTYVKIEMVADLEIPS